jgi:hypothetical protein
MKPHSISDMALQHFSNALGEGAELSCAMENGQSTILSTK